MEQFENFYEGEKGNNQSDLNILNMTVHTFPKDYAKIFWREALEWVILIHDESYDNPEKGIYIGDIIRDKLEKELRNDQS